MSNRKNRDNSENMKQPVLGRDQQEQQGGIQDVNKSQKTGMQGGNRTNLQGQGNVAGSTGTGNQGKAGNTRNSG